MYYSYVEVEYVATSFSPARTDLALKLLTNPFLPPSNSNFRSSEISTLLPRRAASRLSKRLTAQFQQRVPPANICNQEQEQLPHLTHHCHCASLCRRLAEAWYHLYQRPATPAPMHTQHLHLNTHRSMRMMLTCLIHQMKKTPCPPRRQSRILLCKNLMIGAEMIKI